MTRPPAAFLLSVTILVPLLGCVTRGDSPAPKPIPITPLTLANGNLTRTMANRVTVTLEDGYSILLMEGSHWLYRGSVPDGKVYQPRKGTLLTDDKDPKEFNIVTSGKQLVGLYFPAGHRYVPLTQALYFVFQD